MNLFTRGHFDISVNAGEKWALTVLEGGVCHHILASITSSWLEEVNMFQCVLRAACIIRYGRDT